MLEAGGRSRYQEGRGGDAAEEVDDRRVVDVADRVEVQALDQARPRPATSGVGRSVVPPAPAASSIR